MVPRVDFNLYLITDRLNLPASTDLLSQVEAALCGGVRAVQLREKDLSAEELLPVAQQMRDLTREYDAKLLINREVDVALKVGADGVHLGRDAVSVVEARKKLRPEMLIGVSTHSFFEVNRARQDGADFVTFGPVYETPSKEKYGAPLGLELLHEALKESASDFSVFALGGVNTGRVSELKEVGCQQVACIGAILFAGDAEAEARKFLSQL